MLIPLTDTNDKLQLVSGSAATLDVVVGAIDVLSGVGSLVKQATAISSATTTDILAAPSGSNIRTVETINVCNKHASLSCDIQIVLDDNGTDYVLWKGTLDPGEILEYVKGVGWFVVEASYASHARVVLTGDLAAWTTTTLADATGLTLPVVSGGYYRFKFLALYQAAATTTGIKLSVTIPAATAFAAIGDTPVSTAAGGAANIYRDHITASADPVTGTGTPAANTTHIAELEGVIVPSASGNVQLQGASEVAASNVTLKQGSLGTLERLA